MKSTMLIAAGLAVAVPHGAAPAGVTPDWGWLWPVASGPPHDVDAVTPRQVPGSTNRFTSAQAHDLHHAVDWFPDEHPSMPGVVGGGGEAAACGFCHLPTGNGRPENSALAGLPADYIKRQVMAFADGSRRAALPGALTTALMVTTAKAVPASDIDQAATYFSKLSFTSRVRVVETAELAFEPSRFVYILGSGRKQPVGDRIIEVPDDPQRFELRDPHLGYTAYVPPGSIAAGRGLAASGGPAEQPCAMCHGEGLRGGIAPALAGRSPTTMVRHLVAFKSGARANAEAAPMRTIAARLDDRKMIALAAYVATLKP